MERCILPENYLWNAPQDSFFLSELITYVYLMLPTSLFGGFHEKVTVVLAFVLACVTVSLLTVHCIVLVLVLECGVSQVPTTPPPSSRLAWRKSPWKAAPDVETFTGIRNKRILTVKCYIWMTCLKKPYSVKKTRFAQWSIVCTVCCTHEVTCVVGCHNVVLSLFYSPRQI